MKTIVGKIGICLAILHCVGFVVAFSYIALSTDPQAPLVWLVFAIVDFPISLLYYLAGGLYSTIVKTLPSFLAQILYPPHVIHGLLGTIWWYYLPRFFTPRSLGGLWGRKIEK